MKKKLNRADTWSQIGDTVFAATMKMNRRNDRIAAAERAVIEAAENYIGGTDDTALTEAVRELWRIRDAKD